MGVFWMSIAALMLNAGVYDAGLRYLIHIQTFAAMSHILFLRGWVPSGKRWSEARTAGLVAATALLACLGLASTALLDSEVAETRRRDHEEIIRILREKDVHRGWAYYWVSYDVAFRTLEEVKLAPFYVDRIPEYSDEARAADRRAFVFRARATDEPYDPAIMQINARAFQQMARRLNESGRSAWASKVGPYDIVIEMPE